MDIHEMFEKIENEINKKIEFAEDFRYRYGLQEAMATVKDVMNEYQDKNNAVNNTEKYSRKTRKDDFLEKYPTALQCANGTPYVCAYILNYVRNRTECIRSDKYGFCNFDRYSNACINCWSEPLSEEGDK